MTAVPSKVTLAIGVILAVSASACPPNDDDPDRDDDDSANPSDPWIALTATANKTCGIRRSGEARCWGVSSFVLPGEFVQLRGSGCVAGVRTDGSVEDSCGPPLSGPFPGPGPYSFAAGGVFACAIAASGNELADEGTIACWSDQELDFSNVPDGEFSSLALAAVGRGCAITLANDLVCWGAEVEFSRPVVDVSYASFGLCVLEVDGNVACPLCYEGWGTCEVPEAIWSAVSTHDYHACGVTVSGQVLCWGCGGPDDPDYVDSGQCDAPEGTDWVDVSVGRDHSCALNKAGEIHCWGCEGDSDEGQCDVPP